MPNSKGNFVERVTAFWPVLVFGVAGVVWMVKAETVSHGSFIALEKRVIVVEENIPSRDIMLKIQSNQAVMKNQLDRITVFTDSMMERLMHITEKGRD